MTVYFILPVHNEEPSIGKLLHRIKKVMTTEGVKYIVIVVDDGSTDGGIQEIEKIRTEGYPVNIVRHQKRRGLGAAIRTGINEVIKMAGKEDMIVIMDADDTHDPVYVPQMIQRIQDLDVVVASRYSPGGGQPGLSLSRKIASDGANTILRGLFPIKGVREYTNSFRLYRVEIIRNAIQIYRDRFVESNGFTCMAELIIKLHRSGARISEIPFVLEYSRKKGKSKLPILKTIMQYIALMAKMMIKR